MKLLVTSSYFPPHLGGIEIHARNVARGMRARGHEVDVVSSTGRDERVRVTTVPCLRLPYSPIPLKFPAVTADVYHSHVPAPFFARQVLKKRYRPHIITYHNDVVIPERVKGIPIPRSGASWLEKWHERFLKPVLDDAAVIVATTRSYAESSPVLKDYRAKVEIIPNAIWVNDFVPGAAAGARDPIVLYTGRLVEYKGLPLLIRAMKGLPARLVVLGGGEDRARFEELARSCDVHAELRGRVSEAELREWMRRARVLVLPSQSRLEAFGIVLLEAMACGTPVIASNMPGVAEVARHGGFVFADEAELTGHLTHLIEDDTLATELGRKGRAAVERDYNWDMVLDKLEALYTR